MPHDRLNVLSLCTGIGGIEIGLRLAGLHSREVLYVEREAFSIACLDAAIEAGILDEAPVWPDLTTLDGSLLAGKVDIVTAGFPCQPWSCAGQRKGTDDERWIWPDIARIVREVGPRYVFLENVPGLLIAGLGHVLGDLASGGYDAVWDVFSAGAAGAGHRRERLFILAQRVSDSDGGPVWQLPERGEERASPEADGWNSEPEHMATKPLADGDGHGLQGGGSGQEGEPQRPEASGGCPGDGSTGLADIDGGRLEEFREQMQGRGHGGTHGDESDGCCPEREEMGHTTGGHGEIESVLDGTNTQQNTEKWVQEQSGGGHRTVGDSEVESIGAGLRESEQGEKRCERSCNPGCPPFPPGPSDADAWGWVLDRWPELAPAVADPKRSGLQASELPQEGEPVSVLGIGEGMADTADGQLQEQGRRQERRDGARPSSENEMAQPTGERLEEQGQLQGHGIEQRQGDAEFRAAENGRRETQAQPPIRRVADGLPSRVDRLRALGNGVVPVVAAYAFRALAARMREMS